MQAVNQGRHKGTRGWHERKFNRIPREYRRPKNSGKRRSTDICWQVEDYLWREKMGEQAQRDSAQVTTLVNGALAYQVIAMRGLNTGNVR